MPGFVTHYLFGVNTYKELDNTDERHIISRNHHAYSLGLQGPDLFFYFMPVSLGIKPNIANIMHKESTGEFFRQLIMACRSIKNRDDYEIAAAYIQGFMGHYLLDTHLHPYVYSRVGRGVSQRTLGEHFGLETDIDRELLAHYKGLRPAQFSHKAVMDVSVHQETVIAVLLHNAITVTYDIDITPRLIKAAIVSFKIESSLLMDDSKKKHKVINYIERRMVGYELISSLLINDITHINDPCNDQHNEWTNPWNDGHTSTLSVYDVMDKTRNIYLDCIPLMQDALDASYECMPIKNPQILGILGNNSYSSGMDCTIPLDRD